jgi:hypothetical protein
MAENNQAGEKLGTVKWTFGRAENRNHSLNVNSQVTVSAIDAVECGQEYVVEMKPIKGQGEAPFDGSTMFGVEIYQNDTRFTVPVDVMRECGLKPGHSVYVTLYERVKTEQQSITKEDNSDGNAEQLKELSSKVDEMHEILSEIGIDD